jgi:diguanylate cyclase (GGDEF)-like protein
VGDRSAARGRLEASVDPIAPREIVFDDIADLMVSEDSPAAVLDAVAEVLRHAVPHDALTLHAADPSTRRLFPALVRDSAWGKTVTSHVLSYGEGVIGEAAESRRPRLVTRSRPRPETGSAPGAEPGLDTLLVHPLIARAELKGVLCLYRFAGDTGFTEVELETTGRFSVLAALAIDNADIRSNLESLAMTDHLTGLYNHRYFQERLREEVSKANRRAEPLSLLIYDIDDFKDVNDRHGHLLGDQVLHGVASAVSRICRSEEPLFRIGGEEFAVILSGQGGPQAELMGDRIRRAVLTLSFPMQTHVTISVGVAEVPANASSPRDLFACADLALRGAKSLGKNRVCAYSGSTLGPRRASSGDYPLAGQWEIIAEGMKKGPRQGG